MYLSYYIQNYIAVTKENLPSCIPAASDVFCGG